jgi:hypothetical protein
LLSSAPQFGLVFVVLTIFWIDFRRFYHFWLLNSNFRPPPAMKPADFLGYLSQAMNAAASCAAFCGEFGDFTQLLAAAPSWSNPHLNLASFEPRAIAVMVESEAPWLHF